MFRGFLKCCRDRQIFRFYLVIVPILWANLFLAFFSWRIGIDFADGFAMLLWSGHAIVMLVMMVLSAVSMRRMIAEDKRVIRDKHPAFDQLKQLVLLPCCNEPANVLMATLDSLAGQTVSEQLIVVVSFEEVKSDIPASQRLLEEKYAETFRDFFITIHPAGFPERSAANAAMCNGR